MTIDHNRRVAMLASLCRELAGLGLYSVLSDARPALSVRTGTVEPRLWISVSPCGGFFELCPGVDDRMDAADPEGAAKRIADHLWTWSHG